MVKSGLQARIRYLKQARVEGRVSREISFHPFPDTRPLSPSDSSALWNHLSESRDGNRRPFESAIHTLGQRRIRREFKRQRATRSYLSGYRRVRSHTGALFARVKLILP